MKQPTASAICACLYPALNEVAVKAGYMLAVRGGINDDLELIAVPWIRAACDPDELVARLIEYFSPDDRLTFVLPNTRPHGRLEWTIPIGWYGTTINLSVMPLSPGVGEL